MADKTKQPNFFVCPTCFYELCGDCQESIRQFRLAITALHAEPQDNNTIESAFEGKVQELEPEAGKHGRPLLRLTERELADLLDYSCSFPTGTTTGKRWKRNLNFGRKGGPFEPVWIVGEYGEPSEDGKTIEIKWYDTEPAETQLTTPSPEEPASPVDVEVLKWAMYLGWMAARNPFHERMEFNVWYNAVGVNREPEIAALRTKEPGPVTEGFWPDEGDSSGNSYPSLEGEENQDA